MKTLARVPDNSPTSQFFRARWRGHIDWLCPNCGTIRRSRVITWIIKCWSCGNTFGLGLIAYKLRRGPRSRQVPPDFYVPLGEMVRVEVMPGRYQQGEPANRFIE